MKTLTWNSRFVFSSLKTKSRPISDNTANVALRNLGYDNKTMTAHGFRAMARTILDEILEYPVDWIEHQLAHSVRDANGTAYNRTKHLKQRHMMLQDWADYLDWLVECYHSDKKYSDYESVMQKTMGLFQKDFITFMSANFVKNS